MEMTLPSAFKNLFKIFTHKKTAAKSGFAMIALMIFILITSLASVTGWSLQTASRAQDAVHQTDIKKKLLLDAIDRYQSDHAGVAPADLDDLVTTTGAACAADTNNLSGTYRSLQGWCGPYIDRAFSGDPADFKTDGWGTEFDYDGINLKSCGPNKTCGNGDDLSDAV
jgi:type II secretory pathway pseudopilin PulG